MNIAAAGAGYGAGAMMRTQQMDQMQAGMMARGAPHGGDKAMFSKGAEQMQELAQLAKDDPEAFKQAAADIAESLDEKAGEASGFQARMLGNIADTFRKASESGDVQDLRPDGPPPGMNRGMRGGRPAFSMGIDADAVSQTLEMVGSTVDERLQQAESAAA